MWRQLLITLLLLSVLEFWTGAQATFEEVEPAAFVSQDETNVKRNQEKNIDKYASILNLLTKRLEEDEADRKISNLRSVSQDNEEINKDALEPGLAGNLDAQKPGVGETSKTNSSTSKPYTQPQVQPKHTHNDAGDSMFGSNAVFIVVVAACSVAGLVGILMAGVCWYKLNRSAKAASDVEYPAYGVTGPTKERLPSPGDRKLAQSAQMYHYQHQKQQMIAMEKANGEMKHDASDEESEEENEEGDYTVYECPGLAPTGEMEIKNPLFSDETPGTQDPNDKQDG
ncbi:neural proliferation differentiation and control protein 1-like [Gigantopelta aegis]|uniref:neural proliferation differentiation and control protein 1-like n=1 Tax=Gigantopelta aegis TaxID=1735272 RepID=UPI001B88E481|nr:neural proliferation differentiation and control protein 1-like [Gigantopelta aegis]